MMQKRQYDGLDYFRILAAFLVAAIHTSPFASLGGEADFVFTGVMARTAVPFFFMVTGYFLLPQYLFGHSMDRRPLVHSLKKQLILYGMAVLLYLPVNLYAGHFEKVSVGGFFRMLFIDGTFYHLWYLPAVSLGVLIVWFLGIRLPFGALYGISLALYVVGLFGDSYYGLAAQIPILKEIYDGIFLVSSYTRNGLFYAPVFLVMGAEAYGGIYRGNRSGSKRTGRSQTGKITAFGKAAERKTTERKATERKATERKTTDRKVTDRKTVHGKRTEGMRCISNRNRMTYIIGFTVSLVFMVGEGLLLHRQNLQRHDSMYVMLLPVMFFLFRTLLPCGEEGRSRAQGSAENSRNVPLTGKGAAQSGEKRQPGEPAAFGTEETVCRKREGRRHSAASFSNRAAVSGRRLRMVSTGIYIIHPLCIVLVRGIAKAVHLERLLVENSLLHYLAVCVVSCAGACMIAAIAEKIAADREVRGEGEPYFVKGRAWMELSRENLAKNVETLQALLAPGQLLMPAVKADAYGHGADLVAKELNKMGIQNFCVACVSEGVELRKNGITGDILILGYTHPRDFPLLRKYRLTQTVVDYTYGKILDGYGRKTKVHVKIDTGMHRLGERAEKTKEIGRIFRLKNLEAEGIYTHLCADETLDAEDAVFTKEQVTLFREVVRKLEKQGISGLKTHLLASSGLLNYPEFGGDYVRVGIALYGLLSESRTARKGDCAGGKSRAGEALPKLFPVLSLRARIAAVKEVYPGESIGYGCSYVAEDTRKIAVLAIGYADGLPRNLSGGRGRVLIHGQSAPILGRICMDQTIVDITEIPHVKTGEAATVIGRDGSQEITAYELAENAGTITNEILSRLGGRLGRVIL